MLRLPTAKTYTAQIEPGPEWVLPSGLPVAPFRIQVLPPPLGTVKPRSSPKPYGAILNQLGGLGRGQNDSAKGLRRGEAFVGQGSGGGRERDPTSPQIADREQVQSIRSQLDQIGQAGPLTLFINPEQFSVTRTKVQNLQDRSRYGFIYQTWGFEDPEEVGFTVRCGAYISPGRGVQRASRRDSAAWQQLEAILELFSSGGSIYDPRGEVVTPIAVGQTLITYDGWSYRGQLEQLSWGEDESNQLGGAQIEIRMVADLTRDEPASPSAPQPQSLTPPSQEGVEGRGLVPRLFLP